MKDLDSNTHAVRSLAQDDQGQSDKPSVQAGGERSPKFWRSLEQLSETPGFQEMLHRILLYE